MNCKKAAVTTDTCNQACKTREVFFNQLPHDNAEQGNNAAMNSAEQANDLSTNRNNNKAQMDNNIN